MFTTSYPWGAFALQVWIPVIKFSYQNASFDATSSFSKSATATQSALEMSEEYIRSLFLSQAPSEI
ncbi:hypothetical protein A3C18_00725 [Candidatus Kaiserbacteria bacterium RIFCSPHIGHO2_02_FULL_54_11b]|uniref:Uncharacterized protein n=2 Tax=Candidatus Kaiseribacteriota TaxID=1752734 RepID=A0A1F6CRX9_9BACT|nr:MAG: hypothetical protein A2704_02505 [Candidatus Kaiserbacteria bacterium RIFCSPHIGHO2_01_FULL_54_36b]OGG64700.1 MAG: hypothetical protein A3C18_00725 [Candidatus Kaiserbacteria bacterium RIFCSPHIGHO2_02_FULL_54_11b]